ncbi:MAG TPA: hypothetical protein VKZ53_31640 [Candidatus Angelobacter sp.]|nr:hypothetical protein [Candidatus Angelobacter sp.]
MAAVAAPVDREVMEESAHLGTAPLQESPVTLHYLLAAQVEVALANWGSGLGQSLGCT